MITKRKITIIGCGLFLIAIVLSIYHSAPYANEITNDDLESSIAIQAQAIEYRAELGQNSAFAQYFVKEKLAELNEHNEDGAVLARDQIIEDKALQMAAKIEGITVTDNEVQELMKSIVDIGQEDDNYKEIDTICNKYGISFEDSVYKNEAYYRMDCLKNKLYEKNVSSIDFSKKMSDEEYQKAQAHMNQEWDNYVEEAILEYEQSDSYIRTEQFLTNAQLIINNTSNNTLDFSRIEDIEYFE